ncbi:putative ribonuclease H-like domain-containing protein [Tanacetum coccineum]
MLRKVEYDISAMEMEQFIEYSLTMDMEGGKAKYILSDGILKKHYEENFMEGMMKRGSGEAISTRTRKGICSFKSTFSMEAHGAGVSHKDAIIILSKTSRASKPSSSAQNVAFVSQSKSSTNKVKSGFTGAYSTCTPSTSSTNAPEKEVLAGFADEVIYSLFAKQTEDLTYFMSLNRMMMKESSLDGKNAVALTKRSLSASICHKHLGLFARECTSKGIHDGKKKRDSLYQHQEAGKQEKNQMGLLTMDDGIVNWGEHTEAEETNHALMAISSSNEEHSIEEHGDRGIFDSGWSGAMTDKPNVKGVGYRWMFDIDYLTDSMNYIPVSLENQANPHAGASEVTNSAGTPTSIASEEKDEEVELIVVPSAVRIPEEKDESRTSSTNSKKEDSSTDSLEDNPKIQAFRRELEEIALKHLGTVPENNTTSTPSVNTGSHTVNTGRLDHDDSLMPELEIFHKPETGIFDEASYDEEGVITDFNSLPTEIEVSPTPTLRIHSIHPKSQILGDPKSAVQTRSKVQNKSGAHALLSHIQKQQRNNHKDQQHCLFACFLSQEEPKKIAEALQDDSWVQAMQEELLQFKLQQVKEAIQRKSLCLTTLLVFGDPVNPTKVYKVVKALYGLHTRPLKIVQVYVDDIIFGSTNKSWCDEFEALMKSRFQMSSMGELTFFLGLQVKQNKGGIFISQDKYVAEILKKFDLVNVKAAITPMETKMPLTKDEEAFDVDVHLYRSMIGNSKDFSSQCCQEDLQVSQGQTKLGLYTIVATSTTEAEYVAAANCCGQVLWVQNQLLDYGFNFMNTKIHIDNESTICIVKNPVYHSKTKHIEIRHHFIRDCYEKKLINVEKIHTDLNVADLLTKPFDGPRFNYLVVSIGLAWMQGRSAKSGSEIVNTGFAEIVDFLRGSNLRYALTTNPTIYDSLLKQFWQTATANTNADGTLEIKATIDTIRYTISEASIRDSLQLDDATGITMLPNDELFEGMGQIGYPTDGTFTFWKSFFTPQWRYLVHHLLHCISSKSGGWDQFGSNIATALVCLSTGRVYNFSKLIFDGMVANLKSKTKFLMYPRFLQMILNIQTEDKHLYLAVSLTKKIFGNMKRGFRGAPRPLLPSMLLVATNPNAGQEHAAVAQSQPSSSTPQHIYEEPSPVHQHFSPPQEQAPSQMSMDDLLQAVPKLISRIDSLETDLKQTKLTMGNAIVKLVKKVKKLEGFLKRRNIVLSDSEEEEPEAQGRKSQDDPLDSSVQGLVTPSSTRVNASGEEQVEDISPNTLEVAKTLSKVASLKPRSIDKGRRYKRRKEAKGKKVVSSLDFQEEVDAGAEQVNIEQVSTVGAKKSTSSHDKGQREGKAPMISEETPKKSKAKIEANAELSKSMLGSELQGEDFAKKMVDLVNQRKKYFAEERAKAKRNKPMTQSQLKTYMMNYLKNQGTWKLSQLKNLSFEEVKKEFDKLVKQVESFAPINFEATKASLKRFGEELQTKTPKRLKDDEAKDDEPTKKSGKRRKQMARKGLHTSVDKDDSEGSDEDSEQDDSVTGTKTPINPVPVAMKTPSIATYKIIKQGEKGAYQIVREDGTDIVYINFGAMLKDITRDDLTELYRIVMNRYGMDGPEDKLEKIFWKYLKDMFEEPLSTDPVWMC